MLKDWQFYPIVILLIAGMVTLALSFADTPDPDEVLAGFVVEGEQLTQLFPASGTTISIAGDAENPSAYAVLSAHIAREQAPPSAGVFATLGPVYEKAFAGQNIRISITARKGQATPVKSFDAGYFTAGAGDSGWKTFTLSNIFETYSFDFTPGLPQSDPGTDFVGIWPDVPGEQKTVDVKSIRVEIIQPSP